MQGLFFSSGFEEQNGHLTQVEIDEVLRLMSHVRAEVAADDAVPGRAENEI